MKMKRPYFYILDIVICMKKLKRLAFGYRASMEMLHLRTDANNPRDVFSPPPPTSLSFIFLVNSNAETKWGMLEIIWLLLHMKTYS